MMTEILAKILGFYYLAVGITFLLNPARFREVYQAMIKNDAFLYLSGVCALFLGAFIVSVHNIWIFEWPVLITIIGWLILIKGFGLLTYQKFAQKFSFMLRKSDAFYKRLGIFLIFFGLFFLYQGWI
jgi:uncharacterized protein YjeT (DUF2065 family)